VSIVLVHSVNPRLFKHFCTGTLVSNRDVLTSEHCVLNKPQNRVKVLVGSVDLRRSVKCNVLWWLGYDTWAQTHHLPPVYNLNDVAIIRVN
jgi:V8-like Glu-specific endopeptidase